MTKPLQFRLTAEHTDLLDALAEMLGKQFGMPLKRVDVLRMAIRDYANRMLPKPKKSKTK